MRTSTCEHTHNKCNHSNAGQLTRVVHGCEAPHAGRAAALTAAPWSVPRFICSVAAGTITCPGPLVGLWWSCTSLNTSTPPGLSITAACIAADKFCLWLFACALCVECETKVYGDLLSPHGPACALYGVFAVSYFDGHRSTATENIPLPS